MRKHNIKFIKKIKLKKPIAIVAWPGVGNVAANAAEFLKDELAAKEFAFFNPDSYFQPTRIHINNYLIESIEKPRDIFYSSYNISTDNDLIIFISQAQPSGEKAIDYAQELIGFLKEIDTRMIISFGAIPTAIEYNQEPKVWAVVTHKEMIKLSQDLHIDLIPSGYISGMHGLILSMAKKQFIKGMCILGEVPFYAAETDNPISSMAVLRVLTLMLNINVDFGRLKQKASLLNEEIEKAISLVKFSQDLESEVEPISIEEITNIKNFLQSYTKIPDSVRRNIETLFKEAKKDISKAFQLKKELDRWSIYKDYEDRFLDLFKGKLKKED